MMKLYDPKNVDLTIVVLKSFVLGCVFSVNIGLIQLQYFELITISIIPLNVYLICLSIFHLLEFLSTCTWNYSEVDDDSFILEDYQMLLVNFMAVLEYIFTKDYKPFQVYVSIIGFIFIIGGQFIRTYSMYNAGSSFNHYIQRELNQNHHLVTTGIYRYIRHPSYFGFWWWFIGLQLLVNNIFTLIIGTIILWKFFNNRIKFEEAYLIKFFEKDYVSYKDRTNTMIPFIK